MINIEQLRRLGIHLTQADGKLTVNAPGEVWTKRLRKQVRAHKDELVNALEADELRFHLEFTLVYTSNQAQRSTAHGRQHRRALKLWRHREGRLRSRGYAGCIKGSGERCGSSQVLRCSHC